ncbi:RidA family protein [Modestobacter sp. I12A-02628]|uniref:RidA family protein n=1 Tax=Goekera deserti TaxID=2497753 RepID=A0A7K3WCE7_9ACTN|nr:RidA family protein [Goekera deserti]MPQ98420.1 RidA family protein [Goekera deserti]NDI48247.1 RidA family protein [Goekera deserti]NEL53996.1 RidA family protein [Goekera deserti]
MSIELINPAGLPSPDVYVQMAVATGTRTLYLSGQVARDADGRPVGTGDLAAQVAQAFRNVDTALRAAGGTFDDVARLAVYVVDWTPDKLADLGAGVQAVAGELSGSPVRPITLIGVAALGEPDLLVEVEATAVLP